MLAWFDGRRWEFDGAGRVVAHLGRARVPVSRFVTTPTAGWWSWPTSGAAGCVLEWGGRADRRSERVGRTPGRLPLRRAGRLVAGRRAGRASVATSHDEAGRVASVTDADGVVELVNTYDAGRTGADAAIPVRPSWSPSTTAADGIDGGRRRRGGTAQHLPPRPGGSAGRGRPTGTGTPSTAGYDRWGNPIEIVERSGAVDPPGVRPASPPDPAQRCPPARYRRHATTTGPGGHGDVTGPTRPQGPGSATTGASDAVGDHRPGGRSHPARGRRGLVTAVTDADGVDRPVPLRRRRKLVEAIDARRRGHPASSGTPPDGRRQSPRRRAAHRAGDDPARPAGRAPRSGRWRLAALSTRRPVG